MNTQTIPSDQEAFIKAISDENRLKLIGVLAEGNASASDLSARTQLHPAQVARHLELLLQAGVVVSRQTEAGVAYELDTRYVEAIARQRLAAIQTALAEPTQHLGQCFCLPALHSGYRQRLLRAESVAGARQPPE